MKMSSALPRGLILRVCSYYGCEMGKLLEREHYYLNDAGSRVAHDGVKCVYFAVLSKRGFCSEDGCSADAD